MILLESFYMCLLRLKVCIRVMSFCGNWAEGVSSPLLWERLRMFPGGCLVSKCRGREDDRPRASSLDHWVGRCGTRDRWRFTFCSSALFSLTRRPPGSSSSFQPEVAARADFGVDREIPSVSRRRAVFDMPPQKCPFSSAGVIGSRAPVVNI